jgi:hypothetical protein
MKIEAIRESFGADNRYLNDLTTKIDKDQEKVRMDIIEIEFNIHLSFPLALMILQRRMHLGDLYLKSRREVYNRKSPVCHQCVQGGLADFV